MICRQTPRIKLICSLSKKYETVADVGCDHAYTAINLAQMGKKVIASDISEGPLKKAEINIERFGLKDKIDLRLCSGLMGYKENEVDEIIIAGMGGNVISEIIDKSIKIAKSAEMLILQPMTSPEVLRRFLYENDFKIEKEHLVCEDRRIYTIMQVIPEKMQKFSEIDCFLSRYIIENKNKKIYGDYIRCRKSEFEKIISGLRKTDKKKEKLKYYENLLADITKIEKGDF